MTDDSSDPRSTAWILEQIRSDPSDQGAWRAFVTRYERRILGWCRRRGLQRADAEDATQDVLMAMSKQLPGFAPAPQGSFRAWLHRVTDRAGLRLLERRRHSTLGVMPDRLAGGEDFLHRLARDGDRELMARAMEGVRRKVSRTTWEAFRLTTLDGRPGAEVGARLGLKADAVFAAASRVRRLLRDEVGRLECRGGSGPR